MKLNSHKKKIEKKYIILLIILGTCITLGLMSLIVKDDRPLTFAEKALKDVGLSIERVLYSPIRLIIDKVDNYKEMKMVYLKYKNIDKVESKASLLETENKELKESLEELKKTLELNELITDYDIVNASIINRNIGEWYNTLTIDKGEKSGLKPDMIVINNSGLIGKIIKTTFYTSDIKLITSADLNNKISVGIASSAQTTYGLLSGYDIKQKQLMITDIVDNTTISVGDKVTTSGLSNLYPKGIIVGTVSKIEIDEFGISKTILVTSAVNFNNLRYITILKGHDVND